MEIMVILLKTLSISARQTLSLSSTRLYKRIQTSHFTKALLPDLQFNYELQRWMTSGVCTNDINRHKQTVCSSQHFRRPKWTSATASTRIAGDGSMELEADTA